jgi:methionyl-tRNA formyltransferase
MQMDIGIDTGDMLKKVMVPITETETGESLHDKLAVAGAKLIVETLPFIESGEITPEKQDDTQSCYAKMLSKSLGNIQWDKSALENERLIRGLNPWPSAYSSYKEKMVKIWEANALNSNQIAELNMESDTTLTQPGTICKVTKDAILVTCGTGILSITQLQFEGKKRMAVKDFLLGYEIHPGESFELVLK